MTPYELYELTKRMFNSRHSSWDTVMACVVGIHSAGVNQQVKVNLDPFGWEWTLNWNKRLTISYAHMPVSESVGHKIQFTLSQIGLREEVGLPGCFGFRRYER